MAIYFQLSNVNLRIRGKDNSQHSPPLSHRRSATGGSCQNQPGNQIHVDEPTWTSTTTLTASSNETTGLCSTNRMQETRNHQDKGWMIGIFAASSWAKAAFFIPISSWQASLQRKFFACAICQVSPEKCCSETLQTFHFRASNIISRLQLQPV